MERNKYELQREVLARKYETILKDFEDTNDDRRIAWNCYQQIIAACEAMRDSGMENNFICCAVNKSIREQESKIDEIITRFTGKVYKGVRWLDVREELKCDRFTCGYVDCVISMMVSKGAARRFLREQLYDMRPGGMSRWASSWWEKPAGPGPGLTTAPATPGRKSLGPRPSA